MQKRLSSRIIFVGFLISLATLAPQALTAQTLEPIVYTIKFPAPDTHIANVEVKVPTAKRGVIDLMMAVWSPGFSRVENYANRVQDFSARTPDGAPLQVQQPEKNRWRIQTGGRSTVIVSYRLLCSERSVTTNWVGNDLAVLNGPATFITLVEKARRRHGVLSVNLPSLN